jgi:hypothetical protein
MVGKASTFEGNCGEHVNDPDYTGDYGVLVDTLGPDAAMGNCYHDKKDQPKKNCASTGRVYDTASVVCLTVNCGGRYNGFIIEVWEE